jgi:hypothetical protein
MNLDLGRSVSIDRPASARLGRRLDNAVLACFGCVGVSEDRATKWLYWVLSERIRQVYRRLLYL